MFMTKILQMIDKNLDNFKDWGCKFNCVKRRFYCKNNNPVTRFVCCELYA